MPDLQNLEPIVKEYITVETMIASPYLQVNLKKLNGDAGMSNRIADSNIHRPQLALAGYTDFFTYRRIQIFGNTEMYYLRSLTREDRLQAFTAITAFAMPCIILTNDHVLEDDLLQIAAHQNIPVLQSSLETTAVLQLLSEFLVAQFAPQTMAHGSFVDVYGVGMLFSGRSGIGKSEIVLDLVERGHRLVADDAVLLTKKRKDILIGTTTGPAPHFMEIRGLGIIDVRQMFGMRAIRFQKRLEIVVELEEWDSNAEYTRTGLDIQPVHVMDVEVSFVKLPIFPGKNVTVIAEVIALNYLLRVYGYDAAKVFAGKLEKEIERKTLKKPIGGFDVSLPYFDNDYE